jgi:hypothetical protein
MERKFRSRPLSLKALVSSIDLSSHAFVIQADHPREKYTCRDKSCFISTHDRPMCLLSLAAGQVMAEKAEVPERPVQETARVSASVSMR